MLVKIQNEALYLIKNLNYNEIRSEYQTGKNWICYSLDFLLFQK